MQLSGLGDDQIGIRMYRAGFGDCFLVSFPGEGRRRKMLVDCGSIARHRKSMSEIVGQVIADAREGEEDGEPQLDVVVCTHRHRDHVAGFANPAWKQVRVREVWMPWTENPADPEARRILGAQMSLAFGLTRRFAAGADTDEEVAEQTRAALENPNETADGLVELRERATDQAEEELAEEVRRSLITLNALSNQEAMETLHNGFKGSPERYFLPEEGVRGRDPRDRTFSTPALPEAHVHVIGPGRDEETIRSLDPPDGASYFRAAPVAGETPAAVRPPFGAQWRVADDDPLLAGFTFRIVAQDKARLDVLTRDDPALLAASLDGAVNGTSLMFMVGFRGTHLLFPGDAQWGTWRRALDDPQWRELMSRTRFYKVGHHGSHNATPKEFVEQVLPAGRQALAMVSVRPHGRWPEIPREPLMEALEARALTVRADAETAAIAAPFEGGDFWVDTVLTVGAA